MSTLAVIGIIVAVLIVIAIVATAMRNARARRQFGEVQSEAQHDDAQHHRERADEHRTEAAIAEEKAKRAQVEAELDDERAGTRERELRE